mgnify:CR=1 FL=1
MEGIINQVIDLLKTYAFQGGIGGIAIGAFLLFGLVYLYKHPEKEKVLKLFVILFALISVIAMTFGFYGVSNWKQISANRVSNKDWAVQLQTDNTIEDVLEHKELFEPLFKDLIIVLARDPETSKARFYLFNLYSNRLDADNGVSLAHREWERFGYLEKYKDTAIRTDLKQLCKVIEPSEDGRYFLCNND